MRLLVAGGVGFIGSHFVRYVLEKYPDCSVTNLDKLTYASAPENLAHLKDEKRYRFIRGDIRSADSVRELAKDADVIVNFAAETHVDRSILNPLNFIETDMVGTYVLLEAARTAKLQRFVQVSTDEVYGSCDAGSFSEIAPLSPSSPYSASKAAGDLLAGSYHKTYGVPVLITRSSNNFGPFQFPEKLIPLFITNAMEDRPLPIYGDGSNVRDWIYVSDHCRAIDLVLRKGTLGEIYNIGAGNEKSNLEVTTLILAELRKAKELIRFVKDRPGHDRRYSVELKKVSALGFNPEYSFSDGMRLTIDWYVRNRDWWQKRKTDDYWKVYQNIYGEVR
jgi:dTDP-glucose 4,6-dehydratase